MFETRASIFPKRLFPKRPGAAVGVGAAALAGLQPFGVEARAALGAAIKPRP